MFRKKLVAYGSALAVLLTMACVNTNQANAAAVPTAPAHIAIDDFFAPSSGSDSTVLPDNILQLTAPELNQKGSIWSTNEFKLDFTKDFHGSTELYLDNLVGKGGDGAAFVIMNDPDKVKTFNQNLGESMGVWGTSKEGLNDKAIKNSFAVEFDNVDNITGLDGLSTGFGGPGTSENKGKVSSGFPGKADSYVHINSTTYGLYHNHSQSPVKPNTNSVTSISNGLWHSFTFSWDSTTKTFTYQYGGTNGSSMVIDPMSTFGATTAYWGFTGTTNSTSKQNNQVVFEEIPNLNKITSPVTITDQKSNETLVTYAVDKTTQKEVVNQAKPVYSGSTVHYKIIPTELDDSIRDIKDLNTSMKLGNVTYKAGSLKLDNQLQDDSKWSSNKQLDKQVVGDLIKNNPTKTIEFDVTVDPLPTGTTAPITSTDNITYNGKYLLNKQFDYGYQISPDSITLVNKKPTVSLSPYSLNKLQKMTDAKLVTAELVKLAEITGSMGSTGEAIDPTTITSVSNALTDIKALKPGSSKEFSFKSTVNGLTSNTVKVTFTAAKDGTLSFGSLAKTTTFKTIKLGETSIAMHDQDWDTSVVDDRVIGKDWQVSLALTKPFENVDGSHKLLANLKYLKADNSAIAITDKPTVIETGNNQADATTSITDQWTDKTGLALTDISNGNYPGDYSGELTWSLNDVPAS